MDIARPHRVTRSYTQRLVAAPAAVFPLLCPVREADWIEGWDPARVLTHSGVCEPDCVFLTRVSPASPASPALPVSASEAIWYVTRHEPDAGFVEMIRIVPQVTACRLTIALRAAQTGSEALVTYTHTSLGPAGDALVESFTEDHYRKFMQDWEARINHYLAHGVALHAAGP